MRAAIWQTVVFPVPVSPTSRTGSMLRKHLPALPLVSAPSVSNSTSVADRKGAE